MIADENTNGFLKAEDVTKILKSSKLMPISKTLNEISTRAIEEKLRSMAFVKTAQCYKSQNGDVTINITQRLPLLRIKSETGEDYYIDERGGVMPNSNYVSDLIIATGHIDKRYAIDYLMPMAEQMMDNELWSNMFEQINITDKKGIELVPRVGDHVIFIGTLPEVKDTLQRKQEISKMLSAKLSRLDKFYRYGLSKAGWNRYDYINLEFDNQIICHYRRSSRHIQPSMADLIKKDEARRDSLMKEKKDTVKAEGKKVEAEGKKVEGGNKKQEAETKKQESGSKKQEGGSKKPENDKKIKKQ
jgi:cell division protein FtsQ